MKRVEATNEGTKAQGPTVGYSRSTARARAPEVAVTFAAGWGLWGEPVRPLQPSPVRLPYEGFEIVILEAGPPLRFRYEIRHNERSLTSSPTSYASEETALRAARVFVESVNRRLGIDPPEREG